MLHQIFVELIKITHRAIDYAKKTVRFLFFLSNPFLLDEPSTAPSAPMPAVCSSDLRRPYTRAPPGPRATSVNPREICRDLRKLHWPREARTGDREEEHRRRPALPPCSPQSQAPPSRSQIRHRLGGEGGPARRGRAPDRGGRTRPVRPCARPAWPHSPSEAAPLLRALGGGRPVIFFVSFSFSFCHLTRGAHV